MAVGPELKGGPDTGNLAGRTAQESSYRVARTVVLLLATDAMILRQLDHLFQVAVCPLPSLGIATRDNHGAGLFHLGLSKSGLAQFLLLLAVAHDNESPRLKVITAGRFQTGAKNFLEIGIMDGNVFEARCSAAVFDGLAEQLLTCDLCHSLLLAKRASIVAYAHGTGQNRVRNSIPEENGAGRIKSQ